MKTTTQELIEMYSTMLRERVKMFEIGQCSRFYLDEEIEEIFKIILERLQAENDV